MEKNIIICPFCDHEVTVYWSADYSADCPECHRQLNKNTWHSYTWDTTGLDNASSRPGRKINTDGIALDSENYSTLYADVETADKIWHTPAAYIQKHDDSWFLTASEKFPVKINGRSIRKHAELSHCDTITILNENMHLNADGSKIEPGRYDFGIETVELKNISAELNKETTLFAGNIEIKSGEFVGILGPSGCGKSSLIEIMVGLRKNARGKYLINGIDSKTASIATSFAYIPQDIVLHSELTLSDEISCFRQINVKNALPPGFTDRMLRRFDLSDKKNIPTGKLSGGQRRRAGILLELLKNPAILFLDEPTAGLDPKSERIVMSDLKSLSNQGRIVICSTHIMSNIGMFDKVIFMNKNAQLEFFGTPQELLQKYNITDPVDLYDTEPQTASTAVPDEPPVEFHYQSELANWGISWCEFTGYLRRMSLELFRINWKDAFSSPVKFLFTSTIGMLLFQPFAIAEVLNFACAQDFCNPDKKLGFFMAIAVFWLGMNNSVRELVKERCPIRCLERMRRVKLGSYLGAKILWTTLICLVQVSLFYGTLCLYRAGVMEKKITDHSEAYLSREIMLTLFLVCVTGALVGMAASAFCKKENTAVCFLPLVIIPVLFFSQPIINNSNYQTGKIESGEHNKLAVAIEFVMPCYTPQLLTESIVRLNDQQIIDRKECKESDYGEYQKNIENGRKALVKQQLSYIILCLIMICIFQNKREKEWGGR